MQDAGFTIQVCCLYLLSNPAFRAGAVAASWSISPSLLVSSGVVYARLGNGVPSLHQRQWIPSLSPHAVYRVIQPNEEVLLFTYQVRAEAYGWPVDLGPPLPLFSPAASRPVEVDRAKSTPVHNRRLGKKEGNKESSYQAAACAGPKRASWDSLAGKQPRCG